jgi:hypothetical protein
MFLLKGIDFEVPGMFFSTAIFLAPYWDMVASYSKFTTIWSFSFFSSYFVARTMTVRGCFRLKELLIVVNSKYRCTLSQYGDRKVAAESLIAQIN